MADDRLTQQVAADLAAGMTDEQIRQKHSGREWSDEDINGAMAIVRLRHYSPTAAAAYVASAERHAPRRNILTEVLLLFVIFAGIPMAYVFAKNVGAPIFDRFLTAIVAQQEGTAMPTETAAATTSPQPSNSFPASSAPSPVTPAKTTAAAPATTKPATKPATVPVATQQPVASAPVPSVSFSADKTVVSAGSDVTLSWSSSNATSCAGDAFPTNSQTSGSATIKAYGSFDFTLTCKNASHSASRTVSITVQ